MFTELMASGSGGGGITPATEPNTKLTYSTETVDAVRIQGQITNNQTLDNNEVLFSNIPYPPSTDYVIERGLITPNGAVQRSVTVHPNGTITLDMYVSSYLTWNVDISYPKEGI